MPLDTSKQIIRTVADYDLLEKIAEGGMGSVYRARRRQDGELVAMKIVPTHIAQKPVLLRRFEQEYNAAKTLNHPNIVRALDFGYEGICPYLVMEYVEGESLGKRLERERLPEGEAIRLIAQVAQGLHKAHKTGLVHRDVKPDNILVTADGQAKLTDLGLVKELDADLNLTRTGRGLGTPHFMAPEQFRNAKNADARCDIYSLAATLYNAVTGEPPFKSCSPLDAWMKKIRNDVIPPRELVPALSERLDWAIRRSMSADPNQRPHNCREFVEDLTGRSTRKLNPLPAKESDGDLWYLVYKDEDQVIHTVKGSVGGIRRSLKDGLIGDATDIRASRSKLGPFQLLKSHPEFRDLVVEPAPLSPKQTPTPAKSLDGPPAKSVKVGQTPPPRKVPNQPPSRPQVVTQPVSNSDVEDSGLVHTHVPHINFTHTTNRFDWVAWLVWIAVGIAAGVTAVYLFPSLSRLPFF